LAQLIDPSDLTDPSFQVLLKSGGNSIPIRNLDVIISFYYFFLLIII